MPIFQNKKTSQETEAIKPKETSLEHILEALLFYTAKEMTFKELSNLSGHSVGEVKQSLVALQNSYAGRGINLLINKQNCLLVTSSSVADIIAKFETEEEARPLSKSALETLAVVAYNGPVTRMEIDYIRGVNSTYSLRNLQVRGLIDKVKDGQAVLYSPSMDTYRFMGVSAKEELPDYSVVTAKVVEVLKKREEEEKENSPEEVKKEVVPEQNNQ